MSVVFEPWTRPDYRESLVCLGLSPEKAESVARAWPEPSSLSGATAAQLRRHGLTAAQARRVMGAADLARLAIRAPDGSVIDHPGDVVAVVGPVLAMAEHEIMAVLMLGGGGRVIDVDMIGRGSISEVRVTPGEVFRGAIRAAARAVILAHNHPSGDPRPSDADILLTERMMEVGRLVGVDVLDHVVIGRGGDFYSLAAEGRLPAV